MKVSIHGRLRDTLSFIAPMRERSRRLRKGSPAGLAPGAMNRLAEALHPSVIALRVESRRQETDSVVTFRLIPAHKGARIPTFRAGQYVAARFRIRGVRVSRPFSISSTPDEALRGNYYDLTVKLKPGGVCTPFMFEAWQPGAEALCSGPAGCFYHEPLRDGERLVCLAGGTGITPFKSIIADSLEHDATTFTLLYGVSRPEELLFIDELEELAATHPGRLRIVTVCADPDSAWEGERGFLSAQLLRATLPDYAEASYFVCGPDAMKRYLERQMDGWGLRPRQVRCENYAQAVDPASFPTYPGTEDGRRFSIEVRGHGGARRIDANPGETILVSLERAGLDPPSLCRSGDCGWCRSRLVSGDFFAAPPRCGTGAEGHRMRAADEAFGYFHPCRSYPLSDIVMDIPRNPEPEKENAE